MFKMVKTKMKNSGLEIVAGLTPLPLRGHLEHFGQIFSQNSAK